MKTVEVVKQLQFFENKQMAPYPKSRGNGFKTRSVSLQPRPGLPSFLSLSLKLSGRGRKVARPAASSGRLTVPKGDKLRTFVGDG